jgi:hypothetical protein
MSISPSPEKRLEWETRLRQQKESGLPVGRWCRENQITSTSFYYWKNRLYPKPSLIRSDFAELTEAKGKAITLEYRGFRVHVDRTFDSVALKRCLSLLKEIKC